MDTGASFDEPEHCTLELYLDHGRDRDLIAWFEELGGDSDVKMIWKALIEQVLAEDNVPVEAFQGVAARTKKRMAVRLRVQRRYCPCIVRVWHRLPRGNRSSMLIAALRQAMIETRAGNRAVSVSMLTGEQPPPAPRTEPAPAAAEQDEGDTAAPEAPEGPPAHAQGDGFGTAEAPEDADSDPFTDSLLASVEMLDANDEPKDATDE